MYKNIKLHILKQEAVMAEWLRRLTRNQIPYGIAGSNPAGCDIFFISCFTFYASKLKLLDKPNFYLITPLRVKLTFAKQLALSVCI